MIAICLKPKRGNFYILFHLESAQLQMHIAGNNLQIPARLLSAQLSACAVAILALNAQFQLASTVPYAPIYIVRTICFMMRSCRSLVVIYLYNNTTGYLVSIVCDHQPRTRLHGQPLGGFPSGQTFLILQVRSSELTNLDALPSGHVDHVVALGDGP